MKKCHSCLTDISSNLYCTKCLKKLFNNKDIKPLTFDKTEFYKKRTILAEKMSISGVQDKISLTLNGSSLEATATDGRYILKPIPAEEKLDNKDDICANEHLSMQLSEQIFEIETAPNALIPFSNGELAYITKRFDYAKSGIKLDQEDFASVLEFTSEKQGKNYKYDSSYEDCANAIKKHINPSIFALEDFFKRIIFNYLIGNADAHLKNFSLYIKEGRTDYSLSPNYDLLYTTYHVAQDGYMGLEFFNDYQSPTSLATGYATLEDFEQFASFLGIKPIRVKKIFELFLPKTAEIINIIEKSFLSEKGKKAYIKIYLERLKLHLCYSSERYPFEKITQDVIDKYSPSIDNFYLKYQ